jgi:tetratricopeptide (TPR) repeat protein
MPNDADLHFQRGLLFASQGRNDEAIREFQEATRLRPESPEAWNNLGNVLFLRGKIEEAIRSYREAARLRPNYAEACSNLGRALRENDELDEGLTWYRQSVHLRPGHAKSHRNLAAALLETGQLAEAEAHLRESLRLEPGAPSVLCALAANGFYRDSDPQAEGLQARIARGASTLTDLAQLHATLAIVLDRQDQTDLAFHHFAEANRLRREIARQTGTAFDPVENSRMVDRVISVFKPEYFERFRGLGLEDERAIFLVGMPRSGSSLIEQILSQHPDICGLGELRDLPRLAAALPDLVGNDESYPDCLTRLPASMVPDLARRYVSRVNRLAGNQRRVTDKQLGNFLHLGLIATLLPRSRVIRCRRHPLDTCLSCFTHMFREMNFAWDMDDLAQYYKDYQRLMAHWKSVCPLDMLDVVYEELVAEPERISRQMIEFCGLPWDERCLRPYENPRPVRTVSKVQVRQPIYRSSIGRWRRYESQLAPLRQALGELD